MHRNLSAIQNRFRASMLRGFVGSTTIPEPERPWVRRDIQDLYKLGLYFRVQVWDLECRDEALVFEAMRGRTGAVGIVRDHVCYRANSTHIRQSITQL